ncbi:MAG: ABC transporter substrate-binding protein [Spirochaetales bacterium]|nr:ABC transporter substrate-binding protein [Spirochaetales bacterium]
MKKTKLIMIVLTMVLSLAVMGCSKSTQVSNDGAFPAGKMTLYAYGQPHFRQEYYDAFLERNRDIAPEVEVEIIQTEGEADVRQKVMLSFTAGAYDDLPTAISTNPVSMQAMAESGILKDITEFLTPYSTKLVDGALEQVSFGNSYYGLPRSVRPNILFYNNEIFEEYNIDPARMSTIEGWLDVGRELKEKSNGTVFLSYIDPGSRTWRYYGRRGVMPQAGAKIWDDEGNCIIDSDPGSRLAFNTIDTLYKEELVLKSAIMQPPLYDATRANKIATYMIGAFWDEFLRKNLPDMEGKWRTLPSPMYENIGTRGAPVVMMEALIETKNNIYADLYLKYWEDFTFNNEARITWTKSMEKQNAPYPNPISLEMLNDAFWQLPSSYYGEESFRQKEGEGLQNASVNLRVTSDDIEADIIISNELERYLSGDQNMDEAISNMAKNIKSRIGTTDPVQ